MGGFKILCTLAIFFFGTSSVSAKTVTAKASTIDSAEAKISQQANSAGKSYKIIGAHTGNYVYMIAKLTET